MQKTNIKKRYRHFKFRYLTVNNLVIAAAILIGISWAWGSVGMMQRNYALQKEIDSKSRQQTLAKLEVETLQYQQKYYQTSEYKSLSVRENIGLADPGEKVLILPPNSKAAKQAGTASAKAKPAKPDLPPTNMQQWGNFLFGGNSRNLQN